MRQPRYSLPLVAEWRNTNGDTLNELVRRHQAWMHARNLRQSTIDQRVRAVRRLAHAGADPVDADTPEISEHLAARTHAETRATELSHLRQWFKWLVAEGVRSDDPTARIPRPRVRRRLPRPMATNDLIVAIASAPDRVRPMLMLAAHAGLRAVDMCSLRAEDILWGNDPPLLVVTDGKGGRQRARPLTVELEVELRRLPDRGWLFPRRDGQSGHLPPHMVSRLANDHLHTMGISATLHTIRHWFGTEFYRASGHDLRATQEAMGHESPVSTAIYAWTDPTRDADVVASLPTLDGRRIHA